jgi:hypothetical protein
MLKRFLLLMIPVLLVAACGGGGPPVSSSGGSLIEWDRSPNTVVFRADVTGGSSDPFIARSEIPTCTLYGDNRVVWTNELGPFNVQVLEDRLTDDSVREFVNYLALNEQIYSYAARQDNQPAQAVEPVVETLTLFVNNVNHVTDAFAGWDMDYYGRIVNGCRTLSRAPVLVEPSSGFVSAQLVPYDSNAPGLLWDAAANGLRLADLAASGERRWLKDDRNVRVIWNILRTSPPNIQFNEDNIQYLVALEVPSLTRESPPAP